VSRAGLLVAAALLVAAWPEGPPAPGPCPPVSGAARLLCGLPLDLNAARAEDLEALPGIGPARARAIAAARPFVDLAEVGRVHGVGPRTLARIAPWVEVEAEGQVPRPGESAP
jgi:competence protein ComEA